MFCMFYRRFSFCQYPFILTMSAKKTILQQDSENQMLIMARVCTFNVHLYLTFFCISLLLFPHSDVLVTASSPDLSSLQRSLAEKVQMNQTPETRTFFLNLNVRRTHLVEDSINEVCVAIQHCIDGTHALI